MSADISPENPPPVRLRRKTWLSVMAVLVLLYLAVAYVVLPMGWVVYAHRHPALDAVPGITRTGDDHPGDPINVALIGSETELKTALLAAGWFPADPITLKSCVEIAEGTILHRSYDEAPVSPLYLFNRKQDLAFEQPVGHDPRRRHHVRFWKTPQPEEDGRLGWVGSATYDERVGLSHTTGQITHHIAADVDAERDHLAQCLEKAHQLSGQEMIPNFHEIHTGKNGGGDPWKTDGGLFLGTLREKSSRASGPR